MACLRVVLVVSLLFLSAAGQAAIRPYEPSLIDALSLKERLKIPSDVLVVDVRSADEYEYGHLRGAIAADIPDFEKVLPKTKDILIVLYDDNGDSKRVQKMITRLKMLGFHNVKSLKSGLKEWIDKQLPMVSG